MAAGVEITPEAALMKLDNEDQFAAEKDATNGKVYFRTKKFHGQEDIPVQEANNILKNTKVENGSNSQHYSEGYSENEITRSQHEIDGDKEIKIVKKSEIKVSDVDLERVLEEQDTHDLFCPNCNSCITRRVILRKRKRSERSAEETESDASEKKTHKVPHDVDSSLVTAEKTDLDDREPDVFRCLSCFSFFIPTGMTLLSLPSFMCYRKSSLHPHACIDKRHHFSMNSLMVPLKMLVGYCTTWTVLGNIFSCF